MERGLLKIEEAAAYLALGRSKTYELVQQGELPSVKIGRATRVPVSALKAFTERLAALAEGRPAGDAAWWGGAGVDHQGHLADRAENRSLGRALVRDARAA